eukprot:6449707-Amphidinium_carterae.3
MKLDESFVESTSITLRSMCIHVGASCSLGCQSNVDAKLAALPTTTKVTTSGIAFHQALHLHLMSHGRVPIELATWQYGCLRMSLLRSSHNH